MRIDLPIVEGRFLRRYKRFFVDVAVDGLGVVTAHCPNTGSLLGCLAEGRRAILRDTCNPERKLRFVFQAIEVGATLVNVDTSLPNAVVHEALLAGRIPELAGYDTARREVPYGRSSRIDILLEKRGGSRCYVEVKNTTLAEGRTAMFPDAVTERGRKHLRELSSMVRKGHRAVQLFFVSRGDVRRFRPAEAIDPDYASALRRAVRAGVEPLAYRARVRPDRLEIGRRLPVEV